MKDPMTKEVTMQLAVTETSARKRDYPRWIYPPRVGRYQPRGYMSTTQRSFNAKPRLYVGIDGESVLENFAFRSVRPTALYKAVMPEILARLGLPADTKYRWNQKAGCSCGCSPGFVLDIPKVTRRNGTDATPRRIDFYATVTGDGAQSRNDDQSQAIAANRAAQLVAQVG